jgi:hypothetical protein
MLPWTCVLFVLYEVSLVTNELSILGKRFKINNLEKYFVDQSNFLEKN